MQATKTLPDNFSLEYGAHTTAGDGMCLLEAVAYLAGEEHSDSPACACPKIAALGRRLNDALPDDETRTRLLLGLAPRIIGTRSTKEVERRRSFLMLDVSIREIAPLWLEAHPELAEHAAKLRSLPEIVDAETLERGYKVRDAAASAAWDVRRKRYNELRAKIQAVLKTQAKPEGLRDRDLVAAAEAAAEAAVAAAAAAAVAAAEAAAAAVAAAAAAVAAVAAAAVAAAEEAAAVAAAEEAAAEAAVAECPRHPGESDASYSDRLYSYFRWGSGWSKISAAVHKAARDAVRSKHGDLLEKTWALQVSCIERCIAITEAA